MDLSFIVSSSTLTSYCVAHFAHSLRLLDETDVELIDNTLQHVYRRLVIWTAEILLIAVVIYYFSDLQSAVITTIVISISHLILLYLALRLGYSRFDSNLHRFLSNLKRRDMCLFSAYNSDTPTLSLRAVRLRCLIEIRRRIAYFQSAITGLVALSHSKSTSISDFINDEMRVLSSVNGPLDDELLSITALRTCWQFMFLLRSEFLRQLVCALYTSSVFKSVRIMGVAIHTFSATISLSNIFNESNSVFWSVHSHRGVAYGKAAALSPYESIVYQLEWVLQRINSTDAIPQGKQAESLISLLRNVISIIENESGSSHEPEEVLKSFNGHCDFGKLPDVENEAIASPETNTEKEDLQIFEMYTGNEELETLNDKVPSENFAPIQVDTRPLLRELSAVITRRKELCIDREIVALAKLRGVPVEKISRAELDRPVFADDSLKDRCESNQPSKVVSHGAMGHNLNAGDLAAILAQRQQFLSANDGEILAGNSDDEFETV